MRRGSRLRPGALAAALVCVLLGAAGLAGARAAEPAPRKVPRTPTFARAIAPILNRHCVSCHRAGEVAPFSLESYEEARQRAKLLALVTQKRRMPPWKADSHGEFLNERRLTAGQIDLLRRWAEAGAPAGNLAEAPSPPRFPSGWSLGEPDLVVAPAEPFPVAAEGRDIYRCFVIPTRFAEDRYVSAVDVQPGNRTVVHHLLAYVDTTGKARALEAKDPGPGYSSPGGLGFTPAGLLGGWAPGSLPHRLPRETGIQLPKGADLVLEVHYHPSGKPEIDQTRVALYFNPSAAVLHPMRLFPLLNFWFRIPPGAKDYEARAAIPVPAAVTIYNVFPHMHLLGRRMTVTAKLPGGSSRRLIHVPDWDFNWQGFYQYRRPVRLPAGSRIELVARYDNSTDNPRNPSSPPRAVGWGEQTTDEMCLAYLGFTLDLERLPGKETFRSSKTARRSGLYPRWRR